MAIHSDRELIELVNEIGFLPLLDSGIAGFSADDLVADDCRYVVLPDGGWDWPLWKWKGTVVTESGCMYGKFFNKKAGFISREWWPDFCNYRRSKNPLPDEGSIENIILTTLKETGNAVTRDLRKACGFDGKGMRSRFDGYVTRLEMACRIVTEDFVYNMDKHGKPYGWGLSLLTTPEALWKEDAMDLGQSPEESYSRLLNHFKKILPHASESQIVKIIG